MQSIEKTDGYSQVSRRGKLQILIVDTYIISLPQTIFNMLKCSCLRCSVSLIIIVLFSLPSS